MLDAAIKTQLQDVYASLESSLTLRVLSSTHDKQDELVSMLNDIASTSSKINVDVVSETSEYPRFFLDKDGTPTGIAFTGIPGGHEFTSLVLALLNADGKGKLPDEDTLKRVSRLKGAIHLRTFISLSCENCPEVVQALNVMALNHDNFEHEMIDGDVAIGDVEGLNLQGVPSVMSGNDLVSSGKVNFSDLLDRLESHFGAEEASEEDKHLGHYDSIVIGGGPAGVSAAIYIARKGLSVAVVTDRMGGQLQDTKGIENMISIPYIEGPGLSSKLAEHLSEYDVKILENRRVDEIIDGESKTLNFSSGEVATTRSVVMATGAQWRTLGVPGEKEYVGRGVAYCPHCDGPYYKGKDVVVVGGGNSGIEAAIDLSGIVKSVTVLEFMPTLKADEVLVKKAESISNITIIKNVKTNEVLGDDDKVTGLTLEDRDSGKSYEHKTDGVFVQIGLKPNSDLVSSLVTMTKYGEIEIDEKCRTSVAGIYAAGDVTTVPYKQIVIAMGEGAKAGLTVFEDLVVNA
jgi:alkyl hydroperoxide reductase subunit F